MIRRCIRHSMPGIRNSGSSRLQLCGSVGPALTAYGSSFNLPDVAAQTADPRDTTLYSRPVNNICTYLPYGQFDGSRDSSRAGTLDQFTPSCVSMIPVSPLS